MAPSGILSKKLLIISGKGGVGKSTVAASLALLASRRGMRTVVVEIDTVPTVAGLLGNPVEVGYKAREISPGISVMNIDGQTGLAEYIRLALRSKRISEAIFKSKIFQYFVAAAPGVKELMCVGKLWDLAENQWDNAGRPLYDLVIADLPASGHGFSHLRMPQTAVSTLKIGFVKEEADKVLRLLRDPARTAFLAVTLAEEMPVNEALEMTQLVRETLKFRVGSIFVNGIYPDLLEGRDEEEREKQAARMNELRGSPAVGPVVEGALAVRRRRAMQERYLGLMASSFAESLVEIPFIFTKAFGREAIEKISKILEERVVS